MSEFGTMLRAARLSKGYEPEYVAAWIELTSNKYLSWEEGRSRPLSYEAEPLAELIALLGLDAHAVSELFEPLERLALAWNEAHGRHLQHVLSVQGVELRTDKASVFRALSNTTLKRWSAANTKPRPEPLGEFLMEAGLSVEEFLAWGAVPTALLRNEFAQALRQLRKDVGLGHIAFAEALGVPTATLAAMEAGRNLPETGELRTRLEYALGVTVEQVRTAEELHDLSGREEPASAFARLLVKERLTRALSLTQASARLGISPSLLDSLEREQNTAPRMDTLRSISRGYEISPTELAWSVFGQDEEAETFSIRLRRLRQEALLSVNEAAALGGMHHFVWLRYEKGQFPGYTPARLLPMAEVVGVSVEELLGVTPSSLKAFGNWLGAELARAGLSTLQLGLYVGVEPLEVERWLTGQQLVSFRRVPALAKALGYHPSVVRDQLYRN